jgi:hypothetical protein
VLDNKNFGKKIALNVAASAHLKPSLKTSKLLRMGNCAPTEKISCTDLGATVSILLTTIKKEI